MPGYGSSMGAISFCGRTTVSRDTNSDNYEGRLNMGYACYIFGWNVSKGGVNDLIMCCDTIEEGEKQAKRLTSEYLVVQLMNKDGEKIKAR